MSVADVAAVDAALVGLLAADAELATLLPDGVYLDVAPAGKTRFAIVQHQTHHDEDAFRMTAYEEFRYRITARVRETSGVDANAAAYRIHTLLQDVDLEGVDGYTHMATLRVERIKFPEVDAIDNDIRWQIAGGDYEITVSPGDAAPPTGPSYAELVVADGATHYWRLGELTGPLALDAIGGASGTISGGVTLNQPGALSDGNPSMTFNGTTGKVATIAAGTLVPPFSIEVWVRTTQSEQPFFGTTFPKPAGKDMIALQLAGVSSVYLFTSYADGASPNSSVGATDLTGIANGSWHHVVVMFSTGTAVTLAVDTVAGTFEAPLSRPLVGVDARFDFGFSAAHGSYWTGGLDEIAIYPHALTPAQIAAHYAAATTARTSRTRTRKD